MNPFFQNGMMRAPQTMQAPASPMMAMLQQATNIYQTIMNPQAFMKQYYPNVPENYRSSPEQLLQYLQQTGQVNPQMLSFLNQFPCPGR